MAKSLILCKRLIHQLRIGQMYKKEYMNRADPQSSSVIKLEAF